MGEWKEKKNRAPDLKYLERESLKKGDSDTGTAADVELVMKKYDRESNTRVWQGKPASIIRWLSVLFSVYSIYVTLFSTALPEIRLSMFLGMILILGYLHYPIQKGDGRINHMPWYDWVLMAVGAVPFFYFAANAHAIIKLATRVTKNPVMVLMAILAVLSLMELCRRCVGIPILCVVGALLVYTFATVRFGKVIYDLFYTTSGVMNTPINVCAKYIVVFIIFGAFLERTGISNFFIDLANCLCGSSAGGPAKVAVISSALCGMVSGSSVGNTVTTGSVTIPMMKKCGYRPEFAGAVEAAASTGGQIMPPIMGAAAFLMAEYMGVPYATVALKAILPAVLYFAGIYIAVHLEAQKLGLRGIPREELPQMRVLMKQIYLLAPLIVLVVLVSTNTFTMQFSASVAIFAAIAVGALNRNNRITLKKIVDALEAGGRGCLCDGGAGGWMYHIDRSGIEADHGNCGSFPGKTADRAVPDDVMLYRAWHGRSDDGKLLYYGGDLCADSDCTGDRDQSGLRAFLCFLFRNRGGYHTAGGIGSLCGFRDRESASDENGAQCDAAGGCRFYRAVYSGI